MKLRIPIEWKVPAQFEKRLGDSAGRQRAMFTDGHLLLVLHEPPAPDRPVRNGRLFWRDPAGNWRSNTLGDGFSALRQHVGQYQSLASGLEHELDDADSAEAYFALLCAATPLHRSAHNLHATLQQARELVSADRDLINLRDEAGEVERSVELLHSDARHGLDFTIARQAERQGERIYEMAVSAHRLNLLVAAFFPIATVSAIFGMDLTRGTDAVLNSTLFWCVLIFGLAFGLVLATVIARRPVAKSARRGGSRKRHAKVTETPG
jgi:hypothetical protein